jgi:HK97 family phage major capsid protein
MNITEMVAERDRIAAGIQTQQSRIGRMTGTEQADFEGACARLVALDDSISGSAGFSYPALRARQRRAASGGRSRSRSASRAAPQDNPEGLTRVTERQYKELVDNSVASAARQAAKAARPLVRTSSTERLEVAIRSGATEIDQLGYAEVRDLALREIDRARIAPDAAERLVSAVRQRTADCDGDDLARHVVITGSPAYGKAWAKSLSPVVAWTNEERSALDAYNALRARRESRSMSEGGTAGLAIPYMIDTSLVITAGVQSAAMLQVASTPLTTTANWQAFAAPGTQFEWVGENAVIGDDTPSPFTGPDIAIKTAKSVIEFSIEYGMDQPDWMANMALAFNNAYNEAVSATTATGNGTTQPLGIVTALMNTTTNPSHAVVQTAGTLGAVDLQNAWYQVPERFRPRASWMFHRTVAQRISGLAASGAIAPGDWHTLPNGQHLLFGVPCYEVDDFPALTNSTAGTVAFAVVGDFKSGYAVPLRVGGFSQELIPHLRDPATGKPTGMRAALAICRFGGGLIVPTALVVVANS